MSELKRSRKPIKSSFTELIREAFTEFVCKKTVFLGHKRPFFGKRKKLSGQGFVTGVFGSLPKCDTFKFTVQLYPEEFFYLEVIHKADSDEISCNNCHSFQHKIFFEEWHMN